MQFATNLSQILPRPLQPGFGHLDPGPVEVVVAARLIAALLALRVGDDEAELGGGCGVDVSCECNETLGCDLPVASIGRHRISPVIAGPGLVNSFRRHG